MTGFFARIERFLPPAFLSLVFLFAYVIFCGMNVGVLDDADVAWHIATGDKILELGAIPRSDPWSFTAGGQPLYVMSWLWDILLSKLNTWGGLPLLFVAARALLAGLVTLMVQHFLRRSAIKTDVIFFILPLLIYALVAFISIRSQIVGFILIAGFHLLLQQSRGEEGLKHLWWLPALMFLWVNLHGNFLIGLMLLAVYAAEAYVQKKHPRFKRLLTIGLACVAVIPLNPYGFGIYHAFANVLGGEMKAHILEWNFFTVGTDFPVSAWLFFMMITAAFGSARVPLADKMLTAISMAMMVVAIRNIPIFLVLSAPMLAISLQEMIERLERFSVPHADIQEQLRAPKMRVLMSAAVALVLCLSLALIGPLKGAKLQDSSTKFTASLSWFKDHCAGKHFLNDYNFGGRLIYELRGACPVFIDGREGHAYPKELIKAYIDFLDVKPGWQTMFDTYAIDGIYIDNERIFAKEYANGQYRDQWQQVYHDDAASIYLRK